jgi:hypothetical protein
LLPFPNARHLQYHGRYLSVVGFDDQSQQHNLTLYLPTEKLTAFQGQYLHKPRLQLHVHDSICIFSESGCQRLKEKPLLLKLQTLQNEGLYTMALSLATKESHGTSNLVVDIHGAYAEYLLKQGDGPGALAQFLHTIGTWETSRVIRKLSAAKHLEYLVGYLQVLHDRGKATKDHTQLLFSCLIRQKDLVTLNALVSDTHGRLSFDVEVAIRCCIQGGLASIALRLAEAHEQHDLSMEILVHVTQDYDAALRYLQRLNISERMGLVLRFGHVLLDQRPLETTRMLMEMVDSMHPLTVEVLHKLIALFPPQSDQTFLFLSHLLSEQSPASAFADVQLWNAALDCCPGPIKAMQVLTHSKAAYSVDHALIICKSRKWTDCLLYLYERRGQFLDILNIYMEQGEAAEMIRLGHEHGPKDKAIWTQITTYLALQLNRNAKEKEAGVLSPGSEETASPVTTEDGAVAAYLDQVLNYVDNNAIMTPNEILEALMKNPSIPFGVVKKIFSKRISQEKKKIHEVGWHCDSEFDINQRDD